MRMPSGPSLLTPYHISPMRIECGRLPAWVHTLNSLRSAGPEPFTFPSWASHTVVAASIVPAIMRAAAMSAATLPCSPLRSARTEGDRSPTGVLFRSPSFMMLLEIVTNGSMKRKTLTGPTPGKLIGVLTKACELLRHRARRAHESCVRRSIARRLHHLLWRVAL